MYNEKDKLRFISSINVDQYPNYYWDALFAKSEAIEETYGKDLYNFSKKEIMSLYKYFDSKSFDFLRVTNFNLIKYIQWALQEALIIDGQNHYAELTAEEISGCVNKFGLDESIITKAQLFEILNRIVSARDQFILLALFEGIKGMNYCEIINANINDINGNKMTLSTGRTVEVSKDLVRIATDAAKEEKYISPGGREYRLYGDYGAIYKYTKDNSTEEDKIRRFPKACRNLLNALGVSQYVTINSIFTSGLIDKINQFADQNNTSAEEVLRNEKYIEYLSNQYGYNRDITKSFIIKYKDYLH